MIHTGIVKYGSQQEHLGGTLKPVLDMVVRREGHLEEDRQGMQEPFNVFCLSSGRSSITPVVNGWYSD